MLAIYQASAQSSFANFKPSTIDQISAFDPIGNIAISNNHAIVPNRDLSDSCLVTFKNALKEKTPFHVSYINNSKNETRAYQEYFMKLMERIENTETDNLSNAKYGSYIKDLIAPYEGRYFCFVFYSGLEAGKVKAEESTSASTELYFPLGTEKSFLHSYLLIVDKNKGTVAYFNHSKINGSPVRKSNVESQIIDLLTYNQ